jgi:transcriptional regulator with XRE-family HTH domain
VHDERFEWDLADRLRRALRIADVSVQDMASYLEVSRNTVGSWINGRTRPRRRDLRLIALRTGFPLEWLETGKALTANGEGLRLPDLDSNQEPAGTQPNRFVERRVILFPSRRQPVVELPVASAS